MLNNHVYNNSDYKIGRCTLMDSVTATEKDVNMIEIPFSVVSKKFEDFLIKILTSILPSRL